MKYLLLKEVANLDVGIAVTRMKAGENDESSIQKYISPGAIHNHDIIDEKLETINVKNINYKKTCENDIIVKTTTPFDVAMIDKYHEGLIYNSFCIDIKVVSDCVDSSYIFAVLNTNFIKSQLENKVRSYITTPISKNDLENISIPILDIDNQKLIGKLHNNVMKREMIFEQIIKNQKDIIESLIFGQGGKSEL